MKKIVFITLAILAVAVVAVISKGKLQDKGNLMDNTNTYTVIAQMEWKYHLIKRQI